MGSRWKLSDQLRLLPDSSVVKLLYAVYKWLSELFKNMEGGSKTYIQNVNVIVFCVLTVLVMNLFSIL